MRRFLVFGMCSLAFVQWDSDALAGSIDYLTNQSADYIRTFSRNGATDAADVVTFNPAGTAFLPEEGLYLNLSTQTILKFYSITYKEQEYKANTPTPILPAFYVVYRRQLGLGHLAGFAAFNVPAGGGSLNYEDGVPYLLPLSIFANKFNVPPTNGLFEGSSMYLAGTVGAAYEIFNLVSVSAGARIVSANKSYKGHATYDDVYAALDTTKSAVGAGGIFGLHVQPLPWLNFGARYEMPTPLEFKASTTTENLVLQEKTPLASFIDGAKEKRNLPGLLGLGLEAELFGRLILSGSFHYYFIKQADDGPDVTTGTAYVISYDDDYDNGVELGFSVGFRILPQLLVSVAYDHTWQGSNEKTYSDFEYSLNSNSIGGGVKYTLLERLSLTGAIASTLYQEAQNTGLALPLHTGLETFKKTAVVFTLGAEYRLF